MRMTSNLQGPEETNGMERFEGAGEAGRFEGGFGRGFTLDEGDFEGEGEACRRGGGKGCNCVSELFRE